MYSAQFIASNAGISQSFAVTKEDFKKFTHILAADDSNLRDLKRKMPDDSTAEVVLWGSYLDNAPIPDPYYDGIVRSLSRYVELQY